MFAIPAHVDFFVVIPAQAGVQIRSGNLANQNGFRVPFPNEASGTAPE